MSTNKQRLANVILFCTQSPWFVAMPQLRWNICTKAISGNIFCNLNLSNVDKKGSVRVKTRYFSSDLTHCMECETASGTNLFKKRSSESSYSRHETNISANIKTQTKQGNHITLHHKTSCYCVITVCPSGRFWCASQKDEAVVFHAPSQIYSYTPGQVKVMI